MLDADLIGQAGSRDRIATPALTLDIAALRRNIAHMAAHCRAQGIALRPHAKSHKCATIARMQIEAGAIGICCARLGEAEALADAGIDNILITAPIVAPRTIGRLKALNRRMEGLVAVIDDVTMVDALADEAKPLSLLVDIDGGMHRTGIAPSRAVALARLVHERPGLRLMGFQCYAGHVQHIVDRAERAAHARRAMALVRDMHDAFRAAGLPCDIRSGGGTGTHDIDPPEKALTELQAGSYIFMDRQYNEVAFGPSLPFETALTVQMTVISNTVPGWSTTDAGLKAFATDADAPLLIDGPEGASYRFQGDEQGGISLPEGQSLALGSRLHAIVPHCDPTVNLYDRYHVVEGDRLIDLWPIEARGRSS